MLTKTSLIVLFLAAILTASPLLADDHAALFGRIDANGDGLMTADEIKAEGKPLYTRLIRVADRDRDGKLSQQEFEAGLSAGEKKFEMSAGGMTPGRPGNRAAGRPGAPGARPGDSAPPNLRQAFDRLDRDKDGKISESEAGPRIKENFRRLDRDGSGDLDPRELGAAMLMMGRPGNAASGGPRRGDAPGGGASKNAADSKSKEEAKDEAKEEAKDDGKTKARRWRPN